MVPLPCERDAELRHPQRPAEWAASPHATIRTRHRDRTMLRVNSRSARPADRLFPYPPVAANGLAEDTAQREPPSPDLQGSEIVWEARSARGRSQQAQLHGGDSGAALPPDAKHSI